MERVKETVTKENRYTISKDIAQNLQLNGWTLIETFYDSGYGCDIYHLERDTQENK